MLQIVPTRNVRFSYIIAYILVSTIIYILYVLLNISLTYVQINNSHCIKDTSLSNNNEKIKLKYILLWTKEHQEAPTFVGSGRSIFLSSSCKWNNCFVTSNRTYLRNYTEFDVILFNGPRLWETAVVVNDIPQIRSLHQKFVYANLESAANYPVAVASWNGFFNWTWTYRLDSDCLMGYLSIRNATNHVIGPSVHMYWMSLSEMNPIDNITKQRIKSKTKAAAWFVSHCDSLSAREFLVIKIREELQRYGLDVDIYGACGKKICKKDIMDTCLEKLENMYYFYFAFENSFSEDYVTEKLLHALLHNTVPVVYGGANYSRFMPDGIYLDALTLGPKGLAKKIIDAMRYPQRYYYDFFKWKNHYSYHYRAESPDTNDYCKFCAMLNDDQRMRTITTYDRFNVWWSTNITYADFQEYEKLHPSQPTVKNQF